MIGVRRIGTDSRMAHYQMDPERGVIETLGPAMTLPPLLEGVSQVL
jgi:hypothetical protein